MLSSASIRACLAEENPVAVGEPLMATSLLVVAARGLSQSGEAG